MSPHEELGGASVHASKSGVCHLVADNETQALLLVRELLSYIPQNNMEDPPFVPTNDDPLRADIDLDSIIPDNPNKPYDIKEIILKVVDDGHFFEIHEQFAHEYRGRFCASGRSQRRHRRQSAGRAGGRAGHRCQRKSGAFHSLLRCFNIPIMTFVDVPGYMPGTQQEHGGIIRAGAKLLYAYCEATVPKLTVTTRKAYGGAYCVMSSKHIRGDLNLAWPTAEIAVMGPDGAVKSSSGANWKKPKTRSPRKPNWSKTTARSSPVRMLRRNAATSTTSSSRVIHAPA